jgi:hypothetical protein
MSTKDITNQQTLVTELVNFKISDKEGCAKIARLFIRDGVLSISDLNGLEESDVTVILKKANLNAVQQNRLMSAIKGSSAPSTASASASAPASAPAPAPEPDSATASARAPARAPAPAPASAPKQVSTTNYGEASERKSTRGVKSDSASASAPAPASARAPASESASASARASASESESAPARAPASARAPAPASASATAIDFKIDEQGGMKHADKNVHTESTTDCSTLSNPSRNSLEEVTSRGAGEKTKPVEHVVESLGLFQEALKNPQSSSAPQSKRKESAPNSVSASGGASAPDGSASAPASAQIVRPESALQALLSPSHLCPEKSMVATAFSLLRGSENLSDKLIPKELRTKEPSSIVPYDPVFKKPKSITNEQFEDIKLQMKKSMDNAVTTGKRGIELAFNIRTVEKELQSNPNQENAEEIRTIIQELQQSFEDLKQKYVTEKATFFKLKEQLTSEPDSLTSTELSQIQKIKQDEHVSSVVSSIRLIFNHMKFSQEGMMKGTAIMDTATPTIIVYPNDKGPSHLTREQHLQLSQVELFLFLREACRTHRLFKDILSVDFQKKTGKYYVKVSSNGDFNLVPSPENITRWILHFFSIVEDILSKYNHKNGTSHQINDVLKSCKSELFKNIFMEFKPESKKFHQRHSGPKDMFSGIFDGDCAVSDPSQTRGGGAVAGGGRSAQSGSSAKNIDSLIQQWKTSMGNVSERPLAQIATHPSSEDSIRFYKAIQEHPTFKESGKKTVAKFLAERRVIRIDGEKTSATFTIISE